MKELVQINNEELLELIEILVRKVIKEVLTSGSESNRSNETVSESQKFGDREKLLSIKECAAFLGCSEVSVHAYKKMGLPFFKTGRTVKFLKSEILVFMRKQSRLKNKKTSS